MANNPFYSGQPGILNLEMEASGSQFTATGIKKRRLSGDFSDGDDGEDSRSGCDETRRFMRQNHSEIEKRRRDKMNTYISELASMIPMCNAMSRKLDKLTVLRMAVQHLKTIRGSINSYTEGHYKPSFLTDEELKHLILQTADGFLFVVGCDRGKILYVSESIQHILNYSQSDLLGQSLFDVLHPKDVSKIKEQLQSSDLSPRERLIDAKTMLPVKTEIPVGSLSRLCPGARRSFFCRMKCKTVSAVKEEADTTTGCQRHKRSHAPDRKFCVIHCTGYLKSLAPSKLGMDDDTDNDGEPTNLSCLVAVGRLQPVILPDSTMCNPQLPTSSPFQFISRHTTEGKFMYIDQRASLLLGYLPQELLGTCLYEYIPQEDVTRVAESHKTALMTLQKVHTKVYRIRAKDGSLLKIQSVWKAFKNPWTKEIDFFFSKNQLVVSDVEVVDSSAIPGTNTNMEYLPQQSEASPSVPNLGGEEFQQLSSHMEASKIGQRIAEDAISGRRGDSSSSSSPVTFDSAYNGTTHSTVTSLLPDNENKLPSSAATLCRPNPSTSHNRPTQIHNVPPGIRTNIQSPHIMEHVQSSTVLGPGGAPVHQTEGNDEAAMAVIMSLLEADGNLGGNVDFSNFPWPLQ